MVASTTPTRARRTLRRVAHRIDWSDDRGVAGAEVLPIGLLVFVIGTLMIVNLWGVIDTKMAVNAAAREGARVMAESDNDLVGKQDARAAATNALTAHKGKVDPQALQVSTTGTWAPCARITVTVTYQIGLINLPFVGAAYGKPTPVSSTHSEIVDPYRSRTAPSGAATGTGPC